MCADAKKQGQISLSRLLFVNCASEDPVQRAHCPKKMFIFCSRSLDTAHLLPGEGGRKEKGTGEEWGVCEEEEEEGGGLSPQEPWSHPALPAWPWPSVLQLPAPITADKLSEKVARELQDDIDTGIQTAICLACSQGNMMARHNSRMPRNSICQLSEVENS